MVSVAGVNLPFDIRSARRCSDSEQNVVGKTDPNRTPSLARERLESGKNKSNLYIKVYVLAQSSNFVHLGRQLKNR